MHSRKSSIISLVISLVVAMALSAAPLAAQGRGKGAGSPKPSHAPAPSSASHGPSHGQAGAPPAARGNDAAAHLRQQPQLRTKLAALLPPGTNLETAATGFKTFGQFVAAVHVSRNLNIPFDQLRARLIGPNAMSLGQAIQTLRPSTDVNREVKRAEAEAREDMRIRR